MVNILNSYFVDIPNSPVSKKTPHLYPENAAKISHYSNQKLTEECKCQIPLMATDFVSKQLRSMAYFKATGIDGFGVKMLKMLSPAYAASIRKIAIWVFRLTFFLINGKRWELHPCIYKTGSRETCSNYRPVSVLPILSKIIEKLVFNHLYEFLNANS